MAVTKQFTGIDYLKFVAALMVVAIHSGTPYYLEVVFRVAVPFFFISSSFLFWYKKKDLLGFVKRMALLYLAWFIIEVPFVYQKFSDSSIWEFLKGLLFSNTFFASWYIIASIEGMALLVLLSKWLNNTQLLLLGCAFYCFAISGGGYYGLLPAGIRDFVDCVDGVIPLTNSFITAFIFCVLGKLFADGFNHPVSQGKRSFMLVLTIASIALLFSEMFLMRSHKRFTDAFFALPMLAWLLLFCATKAPFWERFSVRIGTELRKASTLIYFVHFIILSAIEPFIGLIHGGPLSVLVVKFFITASISVVLAFAIIHLSKKIRLLKLLY